MIIRNLAYAAKRFKVVTQSYVSNKKLDCKMVSQQIISLTKKQISQIKDKLKIKVILALEQDGNPNPASKIYVDKKMEMMPLIGIQSELIRIKHTTTKQQMQKLIQTLNQDPQTTSVIVQLPFPKSYNFDIHDIINQIKKNKNVDGFSHFQTQKPNLSNPKVLKPPTALGITALISYYGIETKGKNIAIIGKGALVGEPLTRLLENYPFNATVTTCDIFTKNIKQITKKADIIISACGEAQLIRQSDIKQGAILIDAGINQQKPSLEVNAQAPSTVYPNQKTLKMPKRRIIGDISSCAYHKARHYTSVPGGVGLLTVSTLAFNVLNSYYLQKNMPTVNLNHQIKLKSTLNQYLKRMQVKNQPTKVMLLSSSYNGLTQRIDKTLLNQGYQTYFQIASSEEAMRQGVKQFQPNIIICPTLMKAIPEDIYKNIKCLIVHPGIKGDRGPSSIDWAILNRQTQWGVTLLEADKQMDAGDIWASENFKIYPNQSKVQIYNLSIVPVAERLILKSLKAFIQKQALPQKLNYQDPLIKGKLHRTIKLNDTQRNVNWASQSTSQIIKKSLAAETQPGLKVTLSLKDKKFTRFTYGYVEQKTITPPANIQPGQIFLRKHQAVCVKTKDGAVWIKQMRVAKNAQNPNPFKTPSTIQLGSISNSIAEVPYEVLEIENECTFQQITFAKKGQIGMLGFDFYNGAMSTSQCLRLAEALQKISQMKDVQILVLKGCSRSWSNGVNLNVIQAAQDPSTQSWNNIKAINKVVKNLYKLNDKITISAIQANAGAGGVYLGLAADYCFAKQGIVLNPHYKNMGLYGSELHTMTAAQKFGYPILNYLKQSAKPLLVKEALQLKLIDELEQINGVSFLDNVLLFSEKLTEDKAQLKRMIIKKSEGRKQFLKYKGLEQYENEELQQMKKDMLENRNQFNEKRSSFVKKITNSK